MANFLDFLNQIDGIIIAVVAICAGLTELFKYLKKTYEFTTSGIKKKATEAVEDIIEEKCNKAVENVERYAQAVTKLDKGLESMLEGMCKKASDIDHSLFDIKMDMAFIKKSSQDTLRAEFLRVYYKYRQYGMILDRDAENLTHIYEDYVALGGNSFVQELYKNEVTKWKVVESWEEIWAAFPDDIRNPYNRQD